MEALAHPELRRWIQAKATAAGSDTASPVETQSSPELATATSTPSSTTFPMPSTTPLGKQISAYNNLALSSGYGISFVAGGPPPPELDISYAFGNGTASQDLWSNNGGEFESDTGSISVLAGLPVTWASCRGATAYTSELTSLMPGNTICYTGHGIIAAVTVLKYVSSNNVDYALLDVKVWQNQS